MYSWMKLPKAQKCYWTGCPSQPKVWPTGSLGIGYPNVPGSKTWYCEACGDGCTNSDSQLIANAKADVLGAAAGGGVADDIMPEPIDASELPPRIAPKDTPPIRLMSFGYKYGPPVAPWFVVDVRKRVRNPWERQELRKLNGLDARVQAFVAACKGGQQAIKTVQTKRYCGSIAVGCGSGKHRSVAIVEMAAQALREMGFVVEVVHRDLNGKAKAIPEVMQEGVLCQQ